jgi:hypothetical protein
MTELKLYKFVKDNELEFRWHGDDVMLFVNFSELAEFTALLGRFFFDDGGSPVTLNRDCVCVEMKGICESFGLNLANVFEKVRN